jgi:hypothetical protein
MAVYIILDENARIMGFARQTLLHSLYYDWWIRIESVYVKGSDSKWQRK